MAREIAYFGAGCFWGVEFKFSKVNGVISTSVGYMGGDESSGEVKYEEVGRLGHAETVKIVFDSSKISYNKLLKNFWEIHNPTTKDRQGWDIGKQYRSSIFYTSLNQKKEAIESLSEAQKIFKRKIVTEIVRSGRFYMAEEHHQKYLEKKGKDTC